MQRVFKISSIIFIASVSIFLLFIFSNIQFPIDWLNDPLNQINYPVVVALVKLLNAISGIDLLITLLSLFTSTITGIITVFNKG